MFQCIPPWVYFIWYSLHFLDLSGDSFPMLGKFLAIISWNMFSVPFSLSSPSGTPIMWMLVLLILSQSSLRLSSFVFNIFSLFCSVFVLGPAQQDGAEERVLWNLRKNS